MAKQNWFPKKEADRRALLNTLADKLPGNYANKYGITDAELVRVGGYGEQIVALVSDLRDTARFEEILAAAPPTAVTVKVAPPRRLPGRPRMPR